jgi:hypothetical protein
MARKLVSVGSLEDSLSSMAEAHPKWAPSCWEKHPEPSSWLGREGIQSCGKM